MFNVLLITIDSLRVDYVMNIYLDIFELSDGTFIFSNAIAPSTHTSPSFLSILSGECPCKYGDWFSAYSDKRAIISEIFQENGYRTFAINSNPYISKTFKFNRGFDFFEDNLKLSKKIGLKRKVNLICRRIKPIFKDPYEPGYKINNQVFQFLSKKDKTKPYFLWVHYMDVHGPYVKKDGIAFINRIKGALLWHKALYKAKKMTQKDIEVFKTTYKNGVKNVAQYIKALINGIDLSDTVVIITADHGDYLGEHRLFGHVFELYEEVLRVPLIFKLPSSIGQKGKVISTPVSTMDILPTLVDVLGLKTKSEFDGKSLLPLINAEDKKFTQRYIISEVSRTHACIRKDFWKLIVDYSNGKKELFNLKDDPQENYNLYIKEQRISSELEHVIQDHIAKNRPTEITPQQVRIDDEIKSKLKDLGYID